jgi:hypothetical protein
MNLTSFLDINFQGVGSHVTLIEKQCLDSSNATRVHPYNAMNISVAKQQKKEGRWKDEGDGTQDWSDMAVSLINIM